MLFTQFTLILAVAVGLGALAVVLKQPVIVAFIAAGMLAGPVGWDIGLPQDEMQLLASLGITVLLFLVGIRLDPSLIRTTGPVALVTGIGQVVFTTVVGFLICLLLGFSWVPATYVAIALTFSSTIIIVKLLSDKREIDALHGQIAVGFLIVQDIVAIGLLIALSALGAEARDTHAGTLGMMVVNAVALSGATFVSIRFLLPFLLPLIARSQELLILFAVSWAVAWAAGSDALGLSKEVGAFLAGITMAGTKYREAVGARLVPLRDFLLLFFFLQLGQMLDLRIIGENLTAAFLLSAFVLIGNPLIVVAIMGAMGYHRRTGFLAGLAVAQISEFSLIVIALGAELGHVGQDAVGLVILVGLITISASTYMILYSHRLYDVVQPYLRVFEKKSASRHTEKLSTLPVDIVVFGLGRYGGRILEALEERGWIVRGLDFDPSAVRERNRKGYDVYYGDAQDPELITWLLASNPQAFVCAIPDMATSRSLIDTLRSQGYKGTIVVTTMRESDVSRLQDAGADEVLLPFVDASTEAVDRVDMTIRGTI